MRISDWSSDVCSSDLRVRARRIETLVEVVRPDRPWIVEPHRAADVPQSRNGGRLEAVHALRLVLDDEAALAAGILRRHAGRAHIGMAFERLDARSEEHTSELQSLMRHSYAVFCLKKKKH